MAKKVKIKETVYHGTIFDISHIDLKQGRPHKDFGRGFYLAYLKKQALAVMNKKYRDSNRKDKHKILYTVKLDLSVCDKLNIKHFETADLEWLDFVLMCRKSADVCHSYDIVVGPTADDDTAFCLNMYFEGAYGGVDTYDAKTFLLKQLEAGNLGTQLFIGTERGKSIIKSVEKEIIK